MNIGQKEVGEGKTVFSIAEIGINHNGKLEDAIAMIRIAAREKCSMVKFQKRTLDKVYTPEKLKAIRAPTPPLDLGGEQTNREWYGRLEFGRREYDEIDAECKKLGIYWTASCWDEDSLKFIESYNPPCHKVPSALAVDKWLLSRFADTNRIIIVSTGGCTEEQIKNITDIIPKERLILMQCTMTYPCYAEDIHLNVIPTLRKYSDVVGYSGHLGNENDVIAARWSYGVDVIEKHITLSRCAYGTDQNASLDPEDLGRLMHCLRLGEILKGSPTKRVLECELKSIKSLREERPKRTVLNGRRPKWLTK